MVKRSVDTALKHFFQEKRKAAEHISPYCASLVDGVAVLTLRGGKRTRAFLVWVGHEAARESRVKARTSQELIRAMMGIELFHSFALIHDDIIDQDTVRRGGPAVHVQLGVELGILAGDLALVWADELMGKVKGGDIYQKMKEEVIFGQSLDVMEERRKIGIPKKLIDVYKTAWYTVIRPLQIGAAIGGADEKTLKSFVPYGLAVGEAYQLRDDFLDGTIAERDFIKQVRILRIPSSASPLLEAFARFAIERNA